MRITYVHHSSFLVELNQIDLLFDYTEGVLPPRNQEKPLAVFVSHFHGDHFSPRIFDLEGEEVHYFLSKEIGVRKKWAALAPKIELVKPHQTYSWNGLQVETLRSTDAGVAFWIEAEEKCLYHAGGLSHWHWEGEPDAWNQQMARDYQAEMNRLAGRHAQAAFVPVDPRLGDAYDWGLADFLKAVQADVVFPMHFWGDFTVCQKAAERFQGITQVVKLTKEGETFEL